MQEKRFINLHGKKLVKNRNVIKEQKLNKSNNINELKVGSILTYINLFISCIIPLFYTPIMLRILGQSEYGLYSLSNSVISYLSLLTFGMGSAVVQYVTRYRVKKDKKMINGVVGLFITIYIVLASLVCVVGGVLTLSAESLFVQGLTDTELSKLKILLLIMTASTALSFPVSVFSSVVIAYEKYIFRKIFECISTIVAPIFNLFVLFSGYATIGMAVVGFLIQLANLVIFIVYCKKRLEVYPTFKNMPVHMLKEIWGFSAFIFLSSIVDLLYWSTDKVLIGGMLGTIAVAIYNIGGTFTSMLQNLASAISGVFGTRITQMVFEKRPIEEFSELLIRIGRIQYLIVSLVLSGYIVFGTTFLHFWAGDKYAEAYGIGVVTMLPLAVPLIQSVAFSTIVAKNKHQFRAIIYALIAIVNVVTTYLAIPQYGIMGAAICTGIAYILGNGIIMNVYYSKVIHLDIVGFWKNIAKMSMVPLGLILITKYTITNIFPIKTVSVFGIGVMIYTVVFMVLSWVFTMNDYEKGLILNLIIRLKKGF